MSSFLDKVWNPETKKWDERGVFDPLKRYAFTNIDGEDYVFQWSGIETTVVPGETIELPEYLALHATRGLVDKIMQGIARKDTLEKQKINPMYLAPQGAGNTGIPMARKPYEDKILKEIPMNKSSDRTLDIKRQQVKEQLLADLTAQPSALGSHATATMEEFVEVGVPKAPAQVI